jgi:zinc protease
MASVNPYIGAITEGKFSSTPKDLEYLFQTVYAYFTDLNLDQQAFDGFKQKQSAFYENMAAQPSFFQQRLYAYLMKENPRFKELFN